MQMYGNFEGIPVNSALFGLEINNDPCMRTFNLCWFCLSRKKMIWDMIDLLIA